MTTNTLPPITYNKNFQYNRMAPKYVSNSVSCVDEIARWALDLKGILYKDEPHAPGLYVPVINKLTGQKGLWNNPVFVTTDAMPYTVPSIVQYLDQRAEPMHQLVPEGKSGEEAIRLFNLFLNTLAGPLSKYVYALVLPYRKYALPLFTTRVPRLEKLIFTLGYPILKKALAKGLGLGDGSNDDRLSKIKEVFQEVEELLSDGRRYLVGDRLSLADVAFASIAAPVVLPDNFGGVITKINEIPDELRETVLEMRATVAGQFILRLYQEDRPEMRNQKNLPEELGFTEKLKQSISGIFFGKKFKTKLFYFLQKRVPVCNLPFTKLSLVNSSQTVKELLERDEDFTIEEINGKKMSNLKNAFFLGMDRTNPQFNRERNLVRSVTKKGDMELIRSFVKAGAKEITELDTTMGKLDVVSSLNRVVMTRMIAFYFGVEAKEGVYMKNWLRAIFCDLFLNLGDNDSIHEKACHAALEMKACILELITSRKLKHQNGETLADNILNRLIIAQSEKGNEWFDDDAIRRNISGIIIGALETTNKCVVLVLEELFNRPTMLKKAIDVANKDDMKAMYGFVSEALRFNPHQPLVIRYNEAKQSLKGVKKSYKIPAKRKLFVSTSAAMFDPKVFEKPKSFIPDRDNRYMNYGFGLHECYGKYINAVTIPELTAAVLRLPNVQRAKGLVGKGTGLNEGPFPNNYVVTYDVS